MVTNEAYNETGQPRRFPEKMYYKSAYLVLDGMQCRRWMI